MSILTRFVPLCLHTVNCKACLWQNPLKIIYTVKRFLCWESFCYFHSGIFKCQKNECVGWLDFAAEMSRNFLYSSPFFVWRLFDGKGRSLFLTQSCCSEVLNLWQYNEDFRMWFFNYYCSNTSFVPFFLKVISECTFRLKCFLEKCSEKTASWVVLLGNSYT